MATTFATLGVSQELTSVLNSYGITTPTPVQTKAIPLALKGVDVIVQAQTGTGKTLAFALPLLSRIDTSKDQTQALVLTPTRELALQITAEMAKLAPAAGASVLAAYGGQDVESQIRKLANRQPHIIVATPGRLLDHLRRETVSLGKVRMLVLDEADQMLHMGFLTDVESIIAKMPRQNRQTMLFSATIPDPIRRLGSEYMNNPEDVRITPERITVDTIKQIAIETTDRRKEDTLVELIGRYRPYLAVVFCRTKVRAKKLNEALQEQGIESDELHGDLSQAKREQVMKRFRDARLQVLVATDVAARGLDVEGVTHVFNYDLPMDAESYVHRIGRTGRAGNNGMSVTLMTSRDAAALAHIERALNVRIERRDDSAVARGDLPVRVKPDKQGRRAQEERDAASRGGQSGGPRGRGRAGGADQRSGGRGGNAGRGDAAAAGRGGRGESTSGRGRGAAQASSWSAAPAAGRGGASRSGGNAGGGKRGFDADAWNEPSPTLSRGGSTPRGGIAPAGRGGNAPAGRGGNAPAGRGGGSSAPRGGSFAGGSVLANKRGADASANPWDSAPASSRSSAGGSSRGGRSEGRGGNAGGRGRSDAPRSGGGGGGGRGRSDGGGRSGGRSNNGGGRRGR
ncbi:DEAD/DEAH box helicase [Paenibacillus sp. PR3]|uniref:RNA helicase n=1 Tax=Paenibacillus terricola TaxID=2763503 RepID=A0ABR8MUE4_9BACL|nr:DEAD/DEAH box helicase [Paenibacillus terricola]MBD3919518.1 DEAD/DEAH box helicase [Paenibacillus terricola]